MGNMELAEAYVDSLMMQPSGKPSGRRFYVSGLITRVNTMEQPCVGKGAQLRPTHIHKDLHECESLRICVCVHGRQSLCSCVYLKKPELDTTCLCLLLSAF